MRFVFLYENTGQARFNTVKEDIKRNRLIPQIIYKSQSICQSYTQSSNQSYNQSLNYNRNIITIVGVVFNVEISIHIRSENNYRFSKCSCGENKVRWSLNRWKVSMRSLDCLQMRDSACSSLHRQTPPPVRRVRNDVHSRDVTLQIFVLETSSKGPNPFAWSLLLRQVPWGSSDVHQGSLNGHWWQIVASTMSLEEHCPPVWVSAVTGDVSVTGLWYRPPVWLIPDQWWLSLVLLSCYTKVYQDLKNKKWIREVNPPRTKERRKKWKLLSLVFLILNGNWCWNSFTF